MTKLTDIIEDNIIIDIIETWPQEIINIFEENLDNLKSYLDFEDEIDNKMDEDITIRYQRPQNPYNTIWECVMSEVEEILKKETFIGFHCSRLTNYEIDNIEEIGLKPLNEEFLESKLKMLYNHNLISENDLFYFNKNNSAHKKNRKDRVCMFFASKTLTNEGGLFRLFRSWGGEALYLNNEHNSEINSILFGIGTPCIVLCKVTHAEIDKYPRLSPTLAEIFLNSNEIDGFSYDFELHINKIVKVIKVLREEEQLFEYLTGFSNWILYY